MPGVPRAMDHHSSGCLSAEKFPTFASCWQGGEQQRFQLHDVVQEESLAYGDGLAHWTSEALEAIGEAEALGEKSGARYWFAELHRLRSVFLTAIGAEESKIEASFGEAIRIAKEQKSVSLEKRAEATYAEYRRQKAIGSGGRGFRLPLC